MKHNDITSNTTKIVVPYIGTWIETEHLPKNEYGYVVPYIGTWIETALSELVDAKSAVVPYIGTWIETTRDNADRH